MAVSKKKPSVKIDVEHIDFDSKYAPYQRSLEVKGKDPDFDYRWVRDQPERLESARATGYLLVQRGEVDTIMSAGPDGKIRAGGKHVLVKRPKTIGVKHREFLRKKAHDAVVAPRESFKNKARSVNVKTEDTTEAMLAAPSVSIPDSDD